MKVINEYDFPNGINPVKRKKGIRIEINFRFNSELIRYLMPGYLSEENLKNAERLRNNIVESIELKTFSLLSLFPNGRKSDFNPEKPLLKSVFDSFIKRCNEENKASITLKRYEEILYNKALPYFKNVDVYTINQDKIVAWIESIPGKAKTVRNNVSPVRRALSQFQLRNSNYILPFNFNMKELLSGRNHKRNEIVPFTEDEKSQILAQCVGWEVNLFSFWFEVGIRPSELILLTFNDWDENNKTININKAWVNGNKKDPKTIAGFRKINLNEIATVALNQQKELRKGHNDNSNLIFVNPRTKQQWNSDKSLRYYWHKILTTRTKVSYRCIYAIRHTYGSLLIKSGFEFGYVAQQMGHETIEMLIKHYYHFIQDETLRDFYKTKFYS